MKHLGDIKKIDGHEVEIVDVVCGGSPCQDLSTAGKRAGLAGERSGLFMEQIRIIKEMRERDRELHGNGTDESLRKPRYMLWENVPGALSSGTPKGADFAAVIEETIKVVKENIHIDVPEDGWPNSGCYYAEDGSWSLAYTIHDSQYWGVPQRRRRIALLCDFNGLTAPTILFDPQYIRETEGDNPKSFVGNTGKPQREVPSVEQGLSRDFEPSGEERQGTTTDTEGSTGVPVTLKIRGGVSTDSNGKSAGKGALIQKDLRGCLGVSQDQTLFTDVISMGHDERNAHMTDNGIVDPLTASDYKQPTTIAYGFDQGASRDVGELFLQDKAKTLSNGSCPGHHSGEQRCQRY